MKQEEMLRLELVRKALMLFPYRRPSTFTWVVLLSSIIFVFKLNFILSGHLSTIPLSANELCRLCVLKCNCSVQGTFLGVWELACLSVLLYDGVTQKKKKKGLLDIETLIYHLMRK